MNEGWKCPECGKCYAPWVSACRNAMCGKVEQGEIANIPTPIGPNPWESRTNDPIPGITYWPNSWHAA